MPRWLLITLFGLLLFTADLLWVAPEAVQMRMASAPPGEPTWWLAPLGAARQMFAPTTDFAGNVARFYWSLHLMLAGVAASVLYHLHTGRRQPRDASGYASHGSARWAREADLRRHLRPTGPGLILGKFQGRLLLHPPDPSLPHNQLVAVFGGSGSRKTRSFVMPNLLHAAGEDLIVVDPKGENYAKSAALLAARGYRVRVLNFLRMGNSDRWNPLTYVQGVGDAADLACNLVTNTVNPNRPAKGDPFWDQAEQSLITALVLYVTMHRPPAECHMASVLELGTEPHPADLDLIFEALPREDPARRYYRTFLRAEEKVRAGITAGLGSRLQLWNDDALAALTAGDEVDLCLLGTGRTPTVLYLIIPDSKPTYAPILALFWQQVFQIIYETADAHGGTLPRRVRCRMDELCNCGFIPDFEKKLSTMRSRGVSVEMVIQTLDQLKNRYPQTWSELLGNCDTWLYLGGNDLETAKYITEKLGPTTLQIHGQGSTVSSRTATDSTNLSYTGRPLLTADECLRLPMHEALLLRRGCHPARVRKVDYTELPAARQIALRVPAEYPGTRREPLVLTNTAELLGAPQIVSEGGVQAPDPGAPVADPPPGPREPPGPEPLVTGAPAVTGLAATALFCAGSPETDGKGQGPGEPPAAACSDPFEGRSSYADPGSLDP